MVLFPILGALWPHLRFAVSFQGGMICDSPGAPTSKPFSFGLYFDQVEDSVNFTISTSMDGEVENGEVVKDMDDGVSWFPH